MELKNLEIDLNTKGWEVSGGRSGNVWGQVPSENIPYKDISDAIKKGRKSCIWTCYDPSFYKGLDDRDESKLKESVPKTISATFKPTFGKFSAVAENMGMRIAAALDMPTSYNYLVKFDKEQYPQIVSNFKVKSNAKIIQNIGVVSIDFLQVKDLDTPVDEEIRVVRDGKVEWVPHQRTFTGEQLVSFEESMNVAKQFTTFSGTNFLIKNWIKSVDLLAERYVPNTSKEKLEKQKKKIKSRIVRSFLLREFLGDCDFTDLNGGFVFNEEKQTINYAPNHDYGECFNKLIKTKLDFLPPEHELAEILKWDKDYIKKKIKKSEEMTVEQLAQMYASDSSQENLRFVIENFPEEVKEIMENLNVAIKEKKIDKIVDSYTQMTNDGKPLLEKYEAGVFKKYLNERAKWLNIICENKLDKGQKDAEKIK